jgi:hypothetical protein
MPAAAASHLSLEVVKCLALFLVAQRHDPRPAALGAVNDQQCLAAIALPRPEHHRLFHPQAKQQLRQLLVGDVRVERLQVLDDTLGVDALDAPTGIGLRGIDALHLVRVRDVLDGWLHEAGLADPLSKQPQVRQLGLDGGR